MISNFGCDCIVKKIRVRYNYNDMLFDGSEDGYDYIDISRKTLKSFIFKLQDSFGHIMNLKGNRFSVSLVFSRTISV